MITVVIKSDEFRMHGHAMPKEGALTHSRACAAATMLAFTLGDALEEAGCGVEVKVRSGHMRLRWTRSAASVSVCGVIACGYRRLAAEYPKHVRFVGEKT